MENNSRENAIQFFLQWNSCPKLCERVNKKRRNVKKYPSEKFILFHPRKTVYDRLRSFKTKINKIIHEWNLIEKRRRG